MNEALLNKTFRKGPNYHRIPEVRARRRKIITTVLVLLIIVWAGVTYHLMNRADPNIPAPNSSKPVVIPLSVNPADMNQP